MVAITGATGFIGRHLLADLPQRGYRIRALLRSPADLPAGVESAVTGDLAKPAGLASALDGVDSVVHAAGLAETMSGRPRAEYICVNTVATRRLAHAAADAGVRRFLFLSSVRAQCGPSSTTVQTEDAEPTPVDAYGESKLLAERALAEIDIDWVALRPVLVYGLGVKGNLASLIALAEKPVPLPFGRLSARRSLLAVENLMEAIDVLLQAPGPFRRSFLVADPAPLTIPEIVGALRIGMRRRRRIVNLPIGLLSLLLRASGRGEDLARLSGGLVVDPSGLIAAGWRPKFTSGAGLARLGRDWQARAE